MNPSNIKGDGGSGGRRRRDRVPDVRA
jgi:hypothetical protein